MRSQHFCKQRVDHHCTGESREQLNRASDPGLPPRFFLKAKEIFSMAAKKAARGGLGTRLSTIHNASESRHTKDIP